MLSGRLEFQAVYVEKGPEFFIFRPGKQTATVVLEENVCDPCDDLSQLSDGIYSAEPPQTFETRDGLSAYTVTGVANCCRYIWRMAFSCLVGDTGSKHYTCFVVNAEGSDDAAASPLYRRFARQWRVTAIPNKNQLSTSHYPALPRYPCREHDIQLLRPQY
ncbi:hypothetical protein [Kozakia baliensis]|nr:hypothetical protein [Kozakia baliensis]